jgi:hypothetical protein
VRAGRSEDRRRCSLGAAEALGNFASVGCEPRADARAGDGRPRRGTGATYDRSKTGRRRGDASVTTVAASAPADLTRTRRGVNFVWSGRRGEAARSGAAISAVAGDSIIGAASGGAVGRMSVDSCAGATLTPVRGAGMASGAGGAGTLSETGGCASAAGSPAIAGTTAGVVGSAASTCAGGGAGSGSGVATAAAASGGEVGGADWRTGSRDSGST